MTAQPCANFCPTGGRRNQSKINFIELCRTCSNSEKLGKLAASAANRNQLNKMSLIGGLRIFMELQSRCRALVTDGTFNSILQSPRFLLPGNEENNLFGICNCAYSYSYKGSDFPDNKSRKKFKRHHAFFVELCMTLKGSCNHFRKLTKKLVLGSGATREVRV